VKKKKGMKMEIKREINIGNIGSGVNI